MKSNSRVYVIGHKNPDTDSICSAIAYADIKNRTDKTKTYMARRAGQINEETEYVLKRFGVRAPGYLPNAGTQVKEIEIHEVPSGHDFREESVFHDEKQQRGHTADYFAGQ